MSPEERAREIVTDCFTPGNIGAATSTKLAEAIASALAQARAEGMEEAAKIVRKAPAIFKKTEDGDVLDLIRTFGEVERRIKERAKS